MMRRNKTYYLVLTTLIVCLNLTSFSHASVKLAAGGNAIFTPETIATLIRAKLVDEFKGEIHGNSIRLNLGERKADIKLPNRDSDLGRIAQALGLDKTFHVNIQSLMATLNLPVKNLKFKIRKIETNHFEIDAEWSTPRITLSSKQSYLAVPPGLFEKGFSIVLDEFSSSVHRFNRAILLKATLDVVVSSEGVQSKVVAVDSNLNNFDANDFTLQVGTLRVENQPIQLILQSGNTRLIADNASIHRALDANKKSLVTAIQRVLSKSVASFAKNISTKLNTHLKDSATNTKKSVWIQ